MGYQSFSPQMRLAKELLRAKGQRPALTQAQKDHKKQLDRERTARRLAENLSQRALIESKRT
ncbi:MAG: hypothetical protein J0I65_18630 [Variovorax sp.]|nr:hypothetical protein [Variovorax sp.]